MHFGFWLLCTLKCNSISAENPSKVQLKKQRRAFWSESMCRWINDVQHHSLRSASTHRYPNPTLVKLAKQRSFADSSQSSAPSKAKTSSYLTKQDMWRSYTLSWNPHCVEHSCFSATLTLPSYDHLHLFLVNGLIPLSTYTSLFVWILDCCPYGVLRGFLLGVVFSHAPLVYVLSVSMSWHLPVFGFRLWICLWLLCLYLCLTCLSVLTIIFDIQHDTVYA